MKYITVIKTFTSQCTDLWNKPSLIIAAVGGCITALLGGWDTLIVTLLTLVVIDYITGVIKAIYNKSLSSEIGYKGIIKKFLILLIVTVAVSLQNILPDAIMLREITILFFISNEGVSILENAAELIPLPQKLKDILLQIRSKTDENDDDIKN